VNCFQKFVILQGFVPTSCSFLATLRWL